MTPTEQSQNTPSVPATPAPVAPLVTPAAQMDTPIASPPIIQPQWTMHVSRVIICVIAALLFAPVSYRLCYATWSTIDTFIGEREFITEGLVDLSPIAYMTKIREMPEKTELYIKIADFVKTVPDNIGDVTQLEIVSVTNNPIRALPDSIGNLSRMRILMVRNTYLKTLPATIAQNKLLDVITLQGNKIRYLPDVFTSQHRLEALNLAYNDLTELPPSVRNLNSVVLLDLTGNNFKTFPAYLPPNLEILYLGGNSIPLKELEAAQMRYALTDLIIYY